MSNKNIRRCIWLHPRNFAILWFFTESWGKSSLGARLRTRKVRGRDASLPAPLLVTSLGLVGRGTVGALPQTPQGADEKGRSPPLTLQGADEKGRSPPLDPFSRLSWSRFHAPSACSFLALRLSTCLLPQLSMKNLIWGWRVTRRAPSLHEFAAPARELRTLPSRHPPPRRVSPAHQCPACRTRRC